MPQYLISQSDHKVILRNYEGVISAYNEPLHKEDPCDNCQECPRLKDKDLLAWKSFSAGKT
ncbi:hypothetical protein N752_04945 [Desulforamulus aquiferis]|nr:hypothetical protein N752_04945 [Desulforamulus aquiferis]